MPKAQPVTLGQNPVFPAPHGSWRGHSVKSSLQAIARRIAEGGQSEGVVRMLDDLLRLRERNARVRRQQQRR